MIVGRGTGIGFAVVSELAEQVATQLIGSGRVRRAYLGVSFQELTPALVQQMGLGSDTRGALIAGVEPGGPADRAGLRAGDVVTRVDGAPLGDSQELFRKVIATQVGREMELTALRDGRRRAVRVRTGVRPVDRDPEGSTSAAGAPQSPLGLGLQGLTRQDARRRGVRQGVLVRQVRPDSPAARAGLSEGGRHRRGRPSCRRSPGPGAGRLAGWAGAASGEAGPGPLLRTAPAPLTGRSLRAGGSRWGSAPVGPLLDGVAFRGYWALRRLVRGGGGRPELLPSRKCAGEPVSC